MKYIILSFFILMQSNDKRNCFDKHQGVFEIKTGPTKTTVVRSGDIEIHDMHKNNNKWQFKIEWTSECTYKMFDLKILSGEFTKSDFKMDKETDTIYNRIIDVEGDKFKEEMSRVKDGFTGERINITYWIKIK